MSAYAIKDKASHSLTTGSCSRKWNRSSVMRPVKASRSVRYVETAECVSCELLGSLLYVL